MYRESKSWPCKDETTSPQDASLAQVFQEFTRTQSTPSNKKNSWTSQSDTPLFAMLELLDCTFCFKIINNTVIGPYMWSLYCLSLQRWKLIHSIFCQLLQNANWVSILYNEFPAFFKKNVGIRFDFQICGKFKVRLSI